MKKNRKN